MLKVSSSDFIYVTEKAHLAHNNIGLVVVIGIEDLVRFCYKPLQENTEKLI